MTARLGAGRFAIAAAAVLAAPLALASLWLSYNFGTLAPLFVLVAITAGTFILFEPLTGVYLFLAAIPLEYLRPFGGQVSLAELLVVLTAGAVVFNLVAGRVTVRFTLVHGLISLMVMLIIGGLAFAVEPDQLRKVAVIWVSGFLIFTYLDANATRADVERLLLALALAGGALGLMSIIGVGEALKIRSPTGGSLIRTAGSFQHPNTFGAFLVLVIPPALVLATRGPWQRRLVTGACVALMGTALLFTLSRSAVIGMAAAFFVLLWLPGARRALAIVLVALVLVGGFNIGGLARSDRVELVGNRISSIQLLGKNDPRRQIYKTDLQIIGDHPVLGVGWLQFGPVSAQYGLFDVTGLPYVHGHNIVLTVAAELGLPGLAVFLALITALATTAVGAIRAQLPGRRIELGLLASLAGLMALGLTEYPLAVNVIIVLLLIYAGCIFVLARPDPECDDEEAPPAEVEAPPAPA